MRYGIFGDVEPADRGAVSAYRLRIGVLTGTLPPPTASETMPGPRGTPVRYEHYHRKRASTLEITRENGAITEATLDGWFELRDLGYDSAGVVTRWTSSNRDGFRGARSGRPPSFDEPALPDLEDGDPTEAELDGTPVKVFIDTGAVGLAVSPELAARGTPVPTTMTLIGVAGVERTGLVRFASFRQLGVTRTGQIAAITRLVPEGYDAVEGIGMFARRTLHLGRDRAVRIDRSGCRGGASISSWYGVVTSIVSVSGGPLPYVGWALFDTGLENGSPVEVAYPPRIAAAAKRERLVDQDYEGIGGIVHGRCTTHPVMLRFTGLGAVSQPVCYAPDAFVATGRGVHEQVVVNPVDFLGGPVKIDLSRQLICRDR